MKNITPTVTIITVTYNCENCLQETIDSIKSQSYQNYEYIIVDGKSNDSTLDIVNRNSCYISKWISEPDKGIFDAMNKGIDIAKGEWIIFINAGDYFSDNDSLLRIFNNGNLSEYDIILGRTIYITSHGIVKEKKLFPFYKRRSDYKPMGVCHQSILVRKESLRNYRFELEYKICADYKMIKYLYDNGAKVYETDSYIAMADISQGFSSSNRKAQFYEVVRICGITNR